MIDSWAYLAEKAMALRAMVFLLDGTLVERLKKVEADKLVYLLARKAPDEEIQKDMDRLLGEWEDFEDDGYEEGRVSHFAEKLLTLIGKIEKRYWEEFK